MMRPSIGCALRDWGKEIAKRSGVVRGVAWARSVVGRAAPRPSAAQANTKTSPRRAGVGLMCVLEVSETQNDAAPHARTEPGGAGRDRPRAAVDAAVEAARRRA